MASPKLWFRRISRGKKPEVVKTFTFTKTKKTLMFLVCADVPCTPMHNSPEKAWRDLRSALGSRRLSTDPSAVLGLARPGRWLSTMQTWERAIWGAAAVRLCLSIVTAVFIYRHTQTTKQFNCDASFSEEFCSKLILFRSP